MAGNKENFSFTQIGLDTLALFCKKKSYGSRINNKLYCSHITKQFVLKKYPLFPDKVGALRYWCQVEMPLFHRPLLPWLPMKLSPSMCTTVAIFTSCGPRPSPLITVQAQSCSCSRDLTRRPTLSRQSSTLDHSDLTILSSLSHNR